MAIYKRGKVYWYKFTWNGELIRASTKTGNERAAAQIEAARKTQLAKGEVGIAEKPRVPTLREFSKDFNKAIETQCAERPRTVAFYKSRVCRLLESALADRRLDTIEEELIDKYRQARSSRESRRKTKLSPGSVNRELATLRRLMRLAYDWKVIDRVPRIKLLREEKNRESILPHDLESTCLAARPQPLSNVATLLLDTGLRLGEALSLDWAQVKLEPARGAKFGFSGKAKSRKARTVPLSLRAVEILRQHKPGRSGLVFHHENGTPLQASLLGQQQKRVRESQKLPADFVLHSLRHTFGTRLGEAGADAFTIMRLMGHSTVTVSQPYVHSSPEAVELAFERLTDMNRLRVGTNLGTVL